MGIPVQLPARTTTTPVAVVAGENDTLTESNVDRLASLSGLRSGLKSSETVATGQAEAAELEAQGADAEALAYGAASGIASENARIAAVAGDISLLQQQRQVYATAGQAQAAAAAGGVIGSSVYDVLRSSYQQGALGAQLIGVQTALEVGGYEEAAFASDAEVAAAQRQADAARALGEGYSAQASLAAKQTLDLQALYADELGQLDELIADPTKGASGAAATTAGPWRRDPLTGLPTTAPAPQRRAVFATVAPVGPRDTDLWKQPN